MSKLYPTGMQALLEAFFLSNAPAAGGSIDVAVAGVDDGYVYSDSHASSDDVGDHFVTDAVSLTNATLTGGVLDADDAMLTGLTQGSTIPALIVMAIWDGGSQLLAYIDSTSTGTLPLQVFSQTVTVTWDQAGIFTI